MKALKKSLALLLVSIMLLSTFAFVTANADDIEGRTIVNLQVTQPQVGNKADETIKVDDERFLPGAADMFALAVLGDEITAFSKEPSSEEIVEKAMKNWAAQGGTELENAYYSATCLMIKNGITWIEYDLKDYQKMIDAGIMTKEELDAELKKISKLDLIGNLLQSSSEYGGTFGDSNFSSTARFMKPGETFKEGKSYMCLCQAWVDIKAETNAYIKSCYAIKPYYEQKAEISKNLQTATEEEAAELNRQLDALNAEYKDGLDAVKANQTAIQEKIESVGGTNREQPILTVNGEKTEENFKGMWLSIYDFGEAKKAPTLLDRIISFFKRILDFFKSLFDFIPAFNG